MTNEKLIEIEYQMCNSAIDFIMCIFHASIEGHAFDSAHRKIVGNLYLEGLQETIVANLR